MLFSNEESFFPPLRCLPFHSGAEPLGRIQFGPGIGIESVDYTRRNGKLKLSGDEFDEIFSRARRMDMFALGQIHDAFYPEIYRYVRYRLSDEQVCEDISAEVFLRLIDALHRQRGPSHNLRGWLYGTASNLVNDYLRERYRRKVENLDDGFESQFVDERSPESSWEISAQKQAVREALQELTQDQQHVLALRFSEGRSIEETAQIIGKTITAVKALQFRALASLRRLLDERVSQR
jgi:RNA polymerase sigma-70 factor (ECF subfamily)